MHEYLAKDLTLCMKSRKLLFIGDSMIRQIFWATANKLGIQEHGAEKHADITVGAYGVRVEFVWDPYLNTSKLYQEVAATSPSATGNDEIDAATTLLVGGGLWNARYLGEASYQQYEDSLQNIIDAMGLRNGSTISESSSTSNNSHISTDNLVVIAPIQIPLYGALSPERAKTITPDRVKPMIQHLRRVASRENVAVAWSFHQMTLHEPSTYDQDGLHVDAAVAARMADVLLNLRCNDVLRRNNAKGYPMDKTCCNSYGRPNWAQYVILNCSLGFPPALVLITFKGAMLLLLIRTPSADLYQTRRGLIF